MDDDTAAQRTAPDQDPAQWTGGADGYQRYFADFTVLYADEVLDRLGVGPGSRVLDVAAGTGAASVRAAGRGARVTATDFAPGMVDIAARRLVLAGTEGCGAEVMDGQHLEFDDGGFDASLSMFGLMFFPDVDAGARELARVVRPGGRVATATWDLAAFPLHLLIGGAIAEAVPGHELPPPRLPTWAPLGTVDGLAALFGRVDGLVDVAVRTVVRPWRFDDPAQFFADLPSWSSPIRPLFDALPADRVADAAAAFARIVHAEGGVPDGPGIDMGALVATATVA